VAEHPVRPVSLEDVDLVKQVQAGRTEAFGTLVRKYQDRVFNACWRICGHLEDARDVTQDAFVKALEGLASFRGESGFYTWLFRIAVNLALTKRRDDARRRMLSFDGPASGGTQSNGLAALAVRGGSGAEDEVHDRTELRACVARALHALDDDQRAVVVLRDIEGFDYAEIGAILGIPEGTVKSRLHRARSSLCDVIRPMMDRVTPQ
jgi:RNA polymerase sigma-70 factor (ECF subfamily)